MQASFDRFFGREPTPAECDSILHCSTVFHFADDLVETLIEYAARQGARSPAAYIAKLAIHCGATHVRTADDFHFDKGREDAGLIKELNKGREERKLRYEQEDEDAESYDHHDRGSGGGRSL